MTKEKTLKELILTEDRWTIGALIRLYSFQTDFEKTYGTIEQNSVGFNMYDDDICSGMAKFYLDKGYLTVNQINYLKRCLPKYVNQLLIVGDVEPKDIRVTAPSNEKTKSQKLVSLVKEIIEIRFDYDPDKIHKVKSLGCRWEPDKRYWWIPLNIEVVEQLIEWKFDLSLELKKWYDEFTKVVSKDSKILEIPGLKKALYPFQKEGVAFIESKNGRVLLGDQMGLGKTAQALAWLQLHKDLRPVIIVCPASLKLNWQKEIHMWMHDERIAILSGKKEDILKILGKDLIIINYDIVNSWQNTLKKVHPQVVILDEAHYIKNGKALRTKAIRKLARPLEHILALTGTPIINRPAELYNAIHLISPAMWPSFWKFAQRYCAPKHTGFGWNFNGASNTEELHQKLTKTIMIRRLKKDVLKDLPEKVRTVIPLEISNRADYDRAEADVIKYLQGINIEKAQRASNAEILVQFEVLKQLTADGKIGQCIEWIKNYLEAEDKLVVFATHKKIIEALVSEFKPLGNSYVAKIDGSTPSHQRQAIVEQFQNDPNCKLFIGNIKAAGVGITLTAANSTCFIELGWSPGEHDQAEDRIHRIGQEADSVNAYYLLAQNTVEEEIAKLLDNKRKVLDAVLDGVNTEANSILSDLITKMKHM